MRNLTLITMVLLSISTVFTSCEKEDTIPPLDDYILINEDINVVTTWTADKFYVVEGVVYVDANLTIQPGTVIKFKADAALHFGYNQTTTVTANGTPDKRIVFTSYSSMPTPGAWNGLFFYNNTLENTSLTYCDIDYAGESGWEAVGIYCKLTFNNNRVRYSKSVAINLDTEGAFVAMNGNTVENCGTHAVSLYPYAIHTLGTNNTFICKEGYGIIIPYYGEVTSTHGTSLTWRKQSVPYIFNNIARVETNLTIQPGTILKFNAEGYISFGFYATNTVTAIGTANEPIVFTSSNLTPAAGAWNGVEVYQNTTSNSIFEYCDFNYGAKHTYDFSAGLYINELSGLTVKNCNFNHSAKWGIYLDYCTLSAQSTGNTFNACAAGNIGTSN